MLIVKRQHMDVLELVCHNETAGEWLEYSEYSQDSLFLRLAGITAVDKCIDIDMTQAHYISIT